jgi:hypothetical protein
MYISGEIVQAGDQIRYGGASGQVEFVADPDCADSNTEWYVKEYGGGCMIVTEKFGSIFLPTTADEEDLEFVSRVGG